VKKLLNSIKSEVRRNMIKIKRKRSQVDRRMNQENRNKRRESREKSKQATDLERTIKSNQRKARDKKHTDLDLSNANESLRKRAFSEISRKEIKERAMKVEQSEAKTDQVIQEQQAKYKAAELATKVAMNEGKTKKNQMNSLQRKVKQEKKMKQRNHKKNRKQEKKLKRKMNEVDREDESMVRNNIKLIKGVDKFKKWQRKVKAKIGAATRKIKQKNCRIEEEK